MLPIAPIVDRLRDRCPGLAAVYGASDLERARNGSAIFPAAFVIPAGESASADRLSHNAVRQQVTAGVLVLLGHRDVSDARGEAARVGVDELRQQIRSALLGFVPADDLMPLAFTGADFVTYADGVLWIQDEFATAYHITANAGA